jgi:head-tail adaptor
VVVRGGDLRTRIRIERPVAVPNVYGDAQAVTWEKVVETYAARKVSGSGATEKYEFEQRISSYDTEWRLRYRTPFDPRWRIVDIATGTIHDIIFAADPDGRRREILCRTRLQEPQPASEANP